MRRKSLSLELVKKGTRLRGGRKMGELMEKSQDRSREVRTACLGMRGISTDLSRRLKGK